jgi:hypothetical protein
MTHRTMESLEASGFEGIIKEGSDLYVDYSTPPPCFVHHTDAGGWCERPAETPRRRQRPGGRVRPGGFVHKRRGVGALERRCEGDGTPLHQGGRGAS